MNWGFSNLGKGDLVGAAPQGRMNWGFSNFDKGDIAATPSQAAWNGVFLILVKVI